MEKREPSCTVGGNADWCSQCGIPKKLKIEPPSDPVIPLLGLYPKNPETPIQKNLCAQMLTAALFYHSQVLETA